MQIHAIKLNGTLQWPELELNPISPGLNAIFGPPRCGKTSIATLLAHGLFGKPLATVLQGGNKVVPAGTVYVADATGQRFQVRCLQDQNQTPRLTVAALDRATTDKDTVPKLVAGLSPTVLSPLCAVSFRVPPDIGQLLSAEFAREFRACCGELAPPSSRRLAELAARRDRLAQELEAKIAGERRASGELEARWSELDRNIRREQEQVLALEQRLKAVETSLAETDTRLRYRRLELHLGGQQSPLENCPHDTAPEELEKAIAHSRTVLAELAQREASSRARLASIQTSQRDGLAALAEQKVWLTVARQLVIDLTGEVARLARANASRQCVCQDAHPRLRPIVEAIERQLDSLQSLVDIQQRTFLANELEIEVDQLARSQAEIQRYLNHLLHRQSAATRHVVPSQDDVSGNRAFFSAADAEQLESRRAELEQQRYQLSDQLRSHLRQLRNLRAARETVDRQRAALLSARSIEHVQRELAAVQKKLEYLTSPDHRKKDSVILDENPLRASDFLAQLTNGQLVRLHLMGGGRQVEVVGCDGQPKPLAALSAGQRDLVYLSLCLALLSAASRHGIHLPLVLDEPFERLDASGTAALAAVLADFCHQGHQVLVFTGQRLAAQQLISVGAKLHELGASKQPSEQAGCTLPADEQQAIASANVESSTERKRKRRKPDPSRTKAAPYTAPNGIRPETGHSDAA